MGKALSAETLSITTGQPQTLYLDEKDLHLLEGKPVVIVDDVISTGSTLQGMRLLMEKANAKIVCEAAILTEGERAKWGADCFARAFACFHRLIWIFSKHHTHRLRWVFYSLCSGVSKAYLFGQFLFALMIQPLNRPLAFQRGG